MRLSEEDLQGLKKGLSEFLSSYNDLRVYLFGSRIDDSKKGGDIDLLLVVRAEDLESLQLNKHRAITAAKKYIDDQKLDLTIRSSEALATDVFYQSIQNSLVLLFEK